ncbi:MAG: SDR family oxidoreductase [Bacteroidia bacterium]|nr:SDR family oxidoreductase [Bacteroidia bacterium]
MWTIVTGSSRGIGKQLCMELARNGCKVLAVSRAKTEFEHPGIYSFSVDITTEEGQQALLKKIQENHIRVSAVFHNAATLLNKTFEKISLKELTEVYSVNVFTPFMLTQKLIPYLAVPAHIIMISSMGGYQGSAKFSGLSAYSSSKAALSNLAECLAEEFKERKIFFNSLNLGAVDTEMLKEAFPGYQAPVSSVSMASFIAWFGINGHRWFNGKCIPVSCTTP